MNPDDFSEYQRRAARARAAGLNYEYLRDLLADYYRNEESAVSFGYLVDVIRAAALRLADDERAAVVEWLTQTHGWSCDDCGFNIADLADAIERGEHLRERKP